jgi:hypothetical protein
MQTSILAQAVAEHSNWEPQSRAVARRLLGPPEFRTVWVNSFSSEQAISLRLFSFFYSA